MRINWNKCKRKRGTIWGNLRFVENYFKIREFLEKNMKNQKDIEELRRYGEMQRSQIDMLMEKKEEVEGLKGKNIADFTFGFSKSLDN